MNLKEILDKVSTPVEGAAMIGPRGSKGMLIEDAHSAILALLPKLKLHTHDSIPNYTSGLEEGCSTCIRNQAIKDCRGALS